MFQLEVSSEDISNKVVIDFLLDECNLYKTVMAKVCLTPAVQNTLLNFTICEKRVSET